EVHRYRIQNDLDRALAADVADLGTRVGDPLKAFEHVPARATVFVDGHEHEASNVACRLGFRGVSEVHPRTFAAGVFACTAAVAAFLLAQLTAWPPHEDETLALFVARGSMGHMLHTVLTQRGGAPLHFMIAWVVTHTGGGLTELRVVSALLAV